MKKALVILHFLPYPLISGAHLRTYNVLRLLARRYELDILAFSQRAHLPADGDRSESLRALQDISSHLEFFEVPTDGSRVRWGLLLLLNLFSAKPYSVWRFHSDRMAQSIRSRVATGRYDFVHIDTIALAPYFDLCGDTPGVLVHHNVESLLLARRSRRESNLFNKAYVFLQAAKLKLLERRMMPRFALNVAVSEDDKIELQKIAPSARIEVIPNGTDIDYFDAPARSASETIELLFVGTMTWYPNEDGIMHFIEQMYPDVRAELPTVRLTVIGKSPTERLVEAARRDSSIALEGFVDDVRPYFARATVFIVPLRVGGGTRLKILDAMSMGKAIVSTSIGAEGIDIRPGTDLEIADDPKRFAQAIVDLVRNPTKRADLERNARERIEQKYSWDVIEPHQARLYESITSDA